jgi:hypothetical protein
MFACKTNNLAISFQVFVYGGSAGLERCQINFKMLTNYTD